MKKTILGTCSIPRSISTGSITTVYKKDLCQNIHPQSSSSSSSSSSPPLPPPPLSSSPSTKEMDSMFGSKECDHPPSMSSYDLFERLACDGYNVLRHHVDLLYDLCMIMTSGELSELKNEEDLHWIQMHTLIDENDSTAEKHFKKLIKNSLHSRATLFNDAAHLLKHG
jgi:hypothetical protein